jgi:hypothetical protein
MSVIFCWYSIPSKFWPMTPVIVSDPFRADS